MSIDQLTNKLRWVERETFVRDLASSLVLQQAWQNMETGTLTWIDVPTVTLAELRASEPTAKVLKTDA